MSALKDLCHEWIGRGRAMSPEQCAGEANVSTRTAQRWADMTEDNEPDVQAIRNMLGSTILPAAFRRALADYLFQRSVDLRVVQATPPHGAPHPSPMRLANECDARLIELRNTLDHVLCPTSDGGATITERERPVLDRQLAEIDRLAVDLRRAINAKLARAAG